MTAATGIHKTILWRDRKHWMWFPFSFTKYTLQSEKLLIQKGLLNTKYSECMLYRIVDTELSRNLWQKIFGTGTVTLCTRDLSDPTIVLLNVKRPNMVKELISSEVEAARIRNRVREISGGLNGEHLHDSDGDGIPDIYDND